MRSSSPGAYALLCALASPLGACGAAPEAEPFRVGAGGAAGSVGSAGSAGGGGAGSAGVLDGDGDGDGVADRDDCAPADPARARRYSNIFEDRDRDGYARGGPVEACLGPNESPAEAGFATRFEGSDCDDDDPKRQDLVFACIDADADGIGVSPCEQRCLPWPLPPGYASFEGDCDDADPGRWQLFAYAHVDTDGDGATHPLAGLVCAGIDFPHGYALKPAGDDCDDADASVWLSQALFPDVDGDGVGAGSAQTFCTAGSLAGFSPSGTDCAPHDAAAWQTLAYGYRDADGDGVSVPSPGALCAGASLPAGYFTSPHSLDCDDGNPTVYFDVQGYLDTDSDGVGAGHSFVFCTAGALPPGYVAGGTDCAPNDPARWQTLAYAHVDADGDGATTPASGSLCAGAALPPPYAAQPSGNDCDDADPNHTRWLVIYPDADGDGVGTDPRQVLCLGAALPPGLSPYGDDVDDTDPATFEDEDEDDEELFVILF